MKHVAHAIFVTFFVFIAAISSTFSVETARVFRAGTHLVDISPTNFPVLVNAMFNERSSTNIADRLYVRAIVLEDGDKQIAIAVVDTCMMNRELIDRAKELASRDTGIPTDH